MKKRRMLVNLIGLLLLLAVVLAGTYIYLRNRTYPEIPTCFDNSPDLQPYRALRQTKTVADFLKPPQISVANAQELIELHKFETPNNAVTTLAVSSDNAFVVAGYVNGYQSPKIFKLTSGEMTPVSDVKAIESIAISPDNKLLAFYDFEGNIVLWDISRKTLIASWDVGAASDTNTVQFTADGDLIYSSGKSVYLCNFASKKNTKLFDNISQARFSDIILDSQGEHIIYSTVGDNDSTGKPEVGIWNFGNPGSLQTFNLHNTQITGLSVSMDGQKIASVSTVGTINLVDSQSGKTLPSLSLNSGATSRYNIALNADGSLIVVGNQPQILYRTDGEKGDLSFWDVNKHSLITTLTAHSQEVTSLIFNATGSLIISGSMDGTVKVWGIKAN